MISAISSLPPWSRGWALPAKMNLHRPILVVEDRGQAVQVAEDQRAALVGGEAAGEADGQGLGVEHFVGAGDLGRRRAPRRSSWALQPLPGEDHQPFAAAFVGAPQLRVGNVVDALARCCGRSAFPPTARRGSGRKAADISAASQVCVCTPLVIERDRHLRFGQVRPDGSATSSATPCRAAC